MISKEALEEYKKIFKEDYGVELPDQEALEPATRLLHFVELVYKPIKKEWLENEKEQEKTRGNN